MSDSIIIKLVQFTDPHLYGDPAARLRGVGTLPALQATLAAASADIAAAAAILVTGDLVQDDPQGYARFREAFSGLGKPVLCIPGNHDDALLLAQELSAPPFIVGGSFDLPGWRVVQLDSSVAGRAEGRLSREALQGLDDALASAPDRHALICLHHHPVPLDSRWLDSVALTNPDEFFKVLDRHPQVRAVVFGHVHQAFDGERRGVRILGTPSTCTQFLPGSAKFAVDSLPPGYRRIMLDPAGQVTTELKWLSSAQRDQVLAAAPSSRTATSQNSFRM